MEDRLRFVAHLLHGEKMVGLCRELPNVGHLHSSLPYKKCKKVETACLFFCLFCSG